MLKNSVFALGMILSVATLLNLSGCDTGSSNTSAPIESLPQTDDRELESFLVSLREAVVTNRNSAIHHGRLGMALDANGFGASAIGMYAHASTLDPSEMKWHYLQALAESDRGRLLDALSAINRALELAPGYLPSYLAKGQWLLDLGEYGLAREVFDQALELDAASTYEVPLKLGLVQSLIELGEITVASEIFESMADQQLPEYGIQIADRLKQLGGSPIKVEQPVVSASTQNPPTWPDPVAGEVVEYTRGLANETILAQRLIEGDRAEDAIELLLSLQERHPEESQLYDVHSSALFKLGRVDEAASLLDDAVDQFPNSHILQFRLALLYESREDWLQAIKGLERTIQLRPDFKPAYEVKTRLQTGMGDLEGARETLVASLEQGTPDPHSHFKLGVMYGIEGKWVQSVEHLDRAIQYDPSNANAHATLALSLSQLGKYEEALNSIQSAQRIEPQGETVIRAIETLIENGVLIADGKALAENSGS